MKVLFWILLIILGPRAWAQPACEMREGVNAAYAGDGSMVWCTYWCKPAARWMDYRPVWGAQSLTMTPAQQQAFLAAFSTGSASELWNLRTFDVAPDPVKAQLVATRPAAPVVVAKNGTTNTRPAYIVIAATGLRSTTPDPAIRAPVGARGACSAAMVVDGTSTYCSWERTGAGPYSNVVTLVSEVK